MFFNLQCQLEFFFKKKRGQTCDLLMDDLKWFQSENVSGGTKQIKTELKFMNVKESKAPKIIENIRFASLLNEVICALLHCFI